MAHTLERDTSRAIAQVLDGVEADEAAFVLVFFADTHDAEVIAGALDERTGARGVAGTTAGELGALGFTEGGIAALSLSGRAVGVAIEVVPHLDQLSLVPLVNLPGLLAARIGRTTAELERDRHLWLTLVDGLSGRETLLTPFFSHVSPQLDLVGGSLSDTLFDEVKLVHHGRVYRDAAAFVLLEYPEPFHTFHCTHHTFSPHWVTVTGVSGDGLVLEELDGRPAQQIYAELNGMRPEQIEMATTSSRPFGVRFRGRPFPVSILTPLGRDSFKLGAPVHHGERLNLLEAGDLVGQTRRVIASSLEQVGGASCARGMLLFHCLGRTIEARQRDLLEPLFDAMNQAPLCGFNTFGEQFGAMHVNHSISGVIFGGHGST